MDNDGLHDPLNKALLFCGEGWHWGVGPLDSHDL